jgi:SAM-dependent methyltransferase
LGYGELTQVSIDKVLDFMSTITDYSERDAKVPKLSLPDDYNFSSKSFFLDIGHGFGKAVLHVTLKHNAHAQGLEIAKARFDMS